MKGDWKVNRVIHHSNGECLSDHNISAKKCKIDDEMAIKKKSNGKTILKKAIQIQSYGLKTVCF